jgi:hypothetical protein
MTLGFEFRFVGLLVMFGIFLFVWAVRYWKNAPPKPRRQKNSRPQILAMAIRNANSIFPFHATAAWFSAPQM